MPVPEGGTYDVQIYQGSSFTQTFSLREDDEVTVITLDGFSAEAELRPRAGSETLLATFDCTVDGPNGEVTINLTREQTDLLEQSGEYDIFLDNGVPNDRRMFMEGKASFNRKVTVG